MNWCIKGCKELSDLLRNGTNVVGDEKVFYYFHKGATNDYLNSTNWNCSGNPQGEIISVEEFKFRCIDEFIVDCSNNTIEERQEVLKFLVDYRGYNKYYLDYDCPTIVCCNKKEGDSLYDCLVYTTKTFPNHKIYTFEEFKQKIKPSMVKKLNIGDTVTPIENLVYTVSGKKIEIKLVKHRRIKSFRSDNAHFQLEGDSSSWFFTKDFKKVEKKIIGYKLTKPEFEEAAVAICKANGSREVSHFKLLNEDYSFREASQSKDWLEKAGVLNLWFEPVYEEEKKIIKMHSSNKGEFEIEIFNGKAFYRPDNKELTKEFIEEILDWYDDSSTHSRNATHLMYCLKVEELTVGCMKGTRKEDWLKVLKEIE